MDDVLLFSFLAFLRANCLTRAIYAQEIDEFIFKIPLGLL